MGENHTPSWMAFAHARNFTNRRKMNFLIESVHNKLSLDEALRRIKAGDKTGYDFTDTEWKGIQEAVGQIPNYSFLAEKLIDRGIGIVHVMEPYVYPEILKENLKKDAPIIIYTKGNAGLLNKSSIAIIGSRKSSEISLEFADKMAKAGVNKESVIVSGFAKGVDKQALDSALKYHGQSIIVLPQGIDTYKSRTYYSEVVKGNVLVMSAYHPKAPWSVGLAMDRNKTIYGLAKEIYVAESGNSGGTWEGAINGLRRGRKVFVRLASKDEQNANNELIRQGAVPVDMEGNEIGQEASGHVSISEPGQPYSSGLLSDREIIDKVVQELKLKQGKGLTVKEVSGLLQLDIKSANRLNRILSGCNELIKEKKGRLNFYHLKSTDPKQSSMF